MYLWKIVVSTKRSFSTVNFSHSKIGAAWLSYPLRLYSIQILIGLSGCPFVNLYIEKDCVPVHHPGKIIV